MRKSQRGEYISRKRFFQSGGDLYDPLLHKRGFDDHFAGELHAGGAQVEAFVGVDGEGADAAVEVADGRAEEPAAEEAEHRVAEISVQRRHSAGTDAAAEAIAHHEFGAPGAIRPIAELGEEARRVRKVVAVVGVGHQHVVAAGGEDAGVERGAVAADGHGDEARPVSFSDRLGAVGRAIVRNNDFAGDVVVAQCGESLIDARGECLGLVEARHDDGEL
jgi:hypothetical protein